MRRERKITVSPEADKRLQDFKTMHNIKTDREALSKLIEWSLLILKYGSHSGSIQEPECLLRIFYDSKFWCLKHAPRSVELPTIEFCQPCRSRLAAPKHRVADPALKELLNSAEANLKSSDNTIKAHKAVKEVYCTNGGLYVVKSCCDRCNEPCDKKALFYPEQGEAAT